MTHFTTPQDEETCRENILDHNADPRNFGRNENATFSHRELNTNCGDEIEMFVTMSDEGITTDVRFDGIGCAISKAATSMLTEKIIGMHVDRIQELTSEDIVRMLGIPLATSRLKCALIGLKTLHVGLALHLSNRKRIYDTHT